MAVGAGAFTNKPPIRPKLIGRERERVFLHEELNRAIAGHGRLVLLSGEAGIGKTSLARDTVRAATNANVTLLTGHCYDLSSTPPYGPWLDLALGYGRQPDSPPLPAAFAGGQLDEIGSQAALFAETLAFLTALCKQAPVLVLLEDLHWADGPSLELLRFLAARSGLLPVLFLVTYRVDELTRKHPLYQQLPGLIRAGVGLRLDLKRLDAAALGNLIRVHHRLTPEDEERLCAYLERHSEGNPFFAVELMRALEEDGLLTEDGAGVCTLGTLDRVVLPSLLSQVIDVRLARLGETTRKPLSIAAATALEVRPAAKRERGWLLYRAARLLRLADPWRGLDLMRAARQLALQVGDKLLAEDALYSTGLLLCYTNQFDSGLRDMAAGIDHLEAFPSEELSGDSTVAIGLADALPRNEGEADTDLLTSVELHRRFGMHHRRGGQPWFLAAAGQMAASEPIARAFIAGAESLEQPGGVVRSAIGHAYQGLGMDLAGAGKPDEARAVFAKSRAIYRTLDHVGVIALCCLSEIHWVTLVYAGDDLAYRRALTDEATVAFEHAGGAMAPGLPSAVCRLACMVVEGQWDEALTVVTETPRFDTSYFRAELSEAAAQIGLHRGDRELAQRQIDEWFPNGPDQAPGSRLYCHAMTLQCVAVSLALEADDHETAAAWLAAHDRWLNWTGCLPGVADSKLAWARYHRARGDLPTALACAETALTIASAPRQPLSLLRAHRLTGELNATGGGRTAAEHHLQQAIALADRCQAPFERALAVLALGELRATEGRLDEVAEELDQARTTLVALKAAPALARLAALTTAAQPAPAALPFGLTVREAEVLRLMAQGLTDAAVAERLFISPRTVSQHLRSVYAKLEVNTRAAATRAAIEHGLA
jgi:DNA-binding CsgD family transcriptional regulator